MHEVKYLKQSNLFNEQNENVFKYNVNGEEIAVPKSIKTLIYWIEALHIYLLKHNYKNIEQELITYYFSVIKDNMITEWDDMLIRQFPQYKNIEKKILKYRVLM